MEIYTDATSAATSEALERLDDELGQRDDQAEDDRGDQDEPRG
jgi:hypothetical protein